MKSEISEEQLVTLKKDLEIVVWKAVNENVLSPYLESSDFCFPSGGVAGMSTVTVGLLGWLLWDREEGRVEES